MEGVQNSYMKGSIVWIVLRKGGVISRCPPPTPLFMGDNDRDYTVFFLDTTNSSHTQHKHRSLERHYTQIIPPGNTTIQTIQA